MGIARRPSRRAEALTETEGLAVRLVGSTPLFWASWKIYSVQAGPRGFAIPELASHGDDLPPTLRQRIRYLHLPHGQPARRRSADHRSGAREGRPLYPTRRRARPQTGQGGGYASACRSPDWPRRIARPDPLRDGDGRTQQGRRGVDAAVGER